MEGFKIGKETIVLLKDGSSIVGELMEISALGVTLKITQRQVFSASGIDTLTVHEKDYCFSPMANIIFMDQEST
jgi:hypothetical protein